jgi:DHA2 family multidrug resistance protein-like MFS transporter
VYQARIALPAGVTGTAAAASRQSYAGAVAAAPGLPSRVAATLLADSRAAFTSGLQVTATTSAVLLAAVAVASLLLLRRFGPSGAPERPAEEAAEAEAPAVR